MLILTLILLLLFVLIAGTHDELLASALRGEGAGIYSNLWNMQLRNRDKSGQEIASATDEILTDPESDSTEDETKPKIVK
jgi:hypothetical protein